EESFGRQLSLQLLEGELQSAVALRLQSLHHELQVAASVIQIDAPARQHRHTILRLEFQVSRRHFVTDAADLGGLVLQSEIVEAAGWHLGAGDFTGYPDV